MLNPQILSLIAGMLAGTLRSFMGWLENTGPFNKRMFATTFLRSLILGAFTGYGLQQDPVLTFFAVYTGDTILNKSYKIVKKNGEK